MALLAASACERAASAASASSGAEASERAPFTASRPLRLEDIWRSHACKTNSKEESKLCTLSASFCIAGHAKARDDTELWSPVSVLLPWLVKPS